MIRASILGLGLLAFVSSGCGDDEPTTPSGLREPTVLSGTLNPAEASFQPFRISAVGDVDLTLVSLTASDAPRVALDITVRLSLGYLIDSACNDIMAVTVPTGLAAQIQAHVTSGDYCAKVTDLGRLQGSATYVIRAVAP